MTYAKDTTYYRESQCVPSLIHIAQTEKVRTGASTRLGSLEAIHGITIESDDGNVLVVRQSVRRGYTVWNFRGGHVDL